MDHAYKVTYEFKINDTAMMASGSSSKAAEVDFMRDCTDPNLNKIRLRIVPMPGFTRATAWLSNNMTSREYIEPNDYTSYYYMDIDKNQRFQLFFENGNPICNCHDKAPGISPTNPCKFKVDEMKYFVENNYRRCCAGDHEGLV